MSHLADFIIGLLIIVGSAFCFVAALGIIRLPDVYTRMHAASKAGTLGSGLLLLAVGLYPMDFAVALRSFAGVLFVLLTAPLSAHLLARATYIRGYSPGDETWVDDLQGRYHPHKVAPDSTRIEQPDE